MPPAVAFSASSIRSRRTSPHDAPQTRQAMDYPRVQHTLPADVPQLGLVLVIAGP